MLREPKKILYPPHRRLAFCVAPHIKQTFVLHFGLVESQINTPGQLNVVMDELWMKTFY